MRETEDEEEGTEQSRMISPDSRETWEANETCTTSHSYWIGSVLVDACLLGYKNRSDNRGHQRIS